MNHVSDDVVAAPEDGDATRRPQNGNQKNRHGHLRACSSRGLTTHFPIWRSGKLPRLRAKALRQ